MILKGEIDPDSAQDREERRHMRSSVFAVLTRKDSFDKTTVKRGDLTARSSPSSSIMLGNALGPKSNSFTGRIESGEVKGSGSGNSPISSAISSARMAAMGSRSNSFTAFISSSLNASSDKGKAEDEKGRKNSFTAAISASLNASSDKEEKDDKDKDKDKDKEKDKDKDKEKDKEKDKGDAGT